MEQIFNPTISVFKSLFNTDTPFELTVGDVANRIQEGNPDLINKINKIRNEETPKEEREVLKKSLFAIMFNGTFSERNDNGLIKHSGICVVDFDKYPTIEEMERERKILIDDKYTLMVFTSPSGIGLKALIKIPVSTKDEHKRRFNAYEKHINSKYFDVANKNVSRVCFESYDPEIYFNQLCETFTQIEVDRGHNYVDRTPTIILRDENEIINRIVGFNRKLDFTEGERNNYIFNLASHFCEYGVDEFSAESFINRNFCDASFTDAEAKTAIKSAYKSRRYGIKYFEDFEKLNIAKSKIEKGISSTDIKEQLNIDDDVINEIKEDVDRNKDVFWEITEKKGGGKSIIVPPYKLMNFLKNNGYNKYYPENAEEPVIIFVKENKVKLSSSSIIIDFVSKFLLDKDMIDVYNYCFKNQGIFSDKSLGWLSSMNLKMLSDTKDISFIPYLNGVVKVSNNDITLMNYVDIDGYIWENQIINRNYSYSENNNNDFKDFVHKVSNSDVTRIESLESTLGYLTHTYKDKTDQKSIIFNDQEIDDNPNGGSGKSLVLTALSNFRRIVKIDGKAFEPSKSDFVYQRVNLDTQILAFDDVKKNFNFESLFSLITEGITVNRKNKDEIFIPFERSPKIVITTNYVINGAGSSHDRRRHEIEFYQYFNSKRNPLNEYGRLLFDEWKSADWIKFDNYMIENIQLYLNKGLTQVVSINADLKRLIQSTSKDFYDFAEDGNFPLDVRIRNQEIMTTFTNEYKSYQKLNTKTFLKWVNEYCTTKGYEIDKNKDTMGRYFIITEKIK